VGVSFDHCDRIPSGSVTCGEFHDRQSDFQLFKKGPASRC
jgi:hypothetical protein